MSDALPNTPDLVFLGRSSALRERFLHLSTSAGLLFESWDPDPELHEEVARRMPRCILLDLDALSQEGLNICRRLKKDGPTRRIPILGLSGGPLGPNIEDALAAGLDDLLGEESADELMVLRIRTALRLAALGERILQTEHAALLGRSLGGIMHEARNPLHGVSLVAYLLARKLGENADGRELIDDLLQGVARLKDILDTVVAVLRANPRDNAMVAVGKVIEIGLKFSSDARTRERLTIENRCPSDLPLVQGQFGRLLQIFLGLFEYLSRAIIDGPGRGVLAIDARDAVWVDGTPCIQVDLQSESLVLDPREVARSFEPFAANSIPPAGAFGLFVARESLREHGGQLQIECNPARGLTFRISLPCKRPTEPNQTAVQALSASG